MPVFIFDCNGELVGNPKGYKNHSTANAQYMRSWKMGTKLYRQINEAFDNRENQDSTLLYQTRTIPAN